MFKEHVIKNRNRLTACAAVFFTCLLLIPAPAELFAQKARQLTIYTIKGPGGIGMIRLFDKPPQAAGFQIRVEALAQADIMASKFIAGEIQIGVLPVNIAAKIAASGKKIQIAAILGNGMLSLLTADDSIQSADGLRGKEIASTGQGATPEFVLRRILKAKGLDGAVRLNFSYAYPELTALLIAGRVQTALLPEPFASWAQAENRSLRPVMDIQREWAALESGENYPMTALVVDEAFAAANPELIAVILQSVKESNEWVLARPRDAARLAEKNGFGIRAAFLERAIPVSAYVFIPAREARPAVERLFKVFLELAPQSIGGRLPADTFYYDRIPLPAARRAP